MEPSDASLPSARVLAGPATLPSVTHTLSRPAAIAGSLSLVAGRTLPAPSPVSARLLDLGQRVAHPDLLHRIITHLPRKDLPSAMRVSSVFHHLAGPLLYRSIPAKPFGPLLDILCHIDDNDTRQQALWAHTRMLDVSSLSEWEVEELFGDDVTFWQHFPTLTTLRDSSTYLLTDFAQHFPKTLTTLIGTFGEIINPFPYEDYPHTTTISKVIILMRAHTACWGECVDDDLRPVVGKASSGVHLFFLFLPDPYRRKIEASRSRIAGTPQSGASISDEFGAFADVNNAASKEEHAAQARPATPIDSEARLVDCHAVNEEAELEPSIEGKEEVSIAKEEDKAVECKGRVDPQDGQSLRDDQEMPELSVVDTDDSDNVDASDKIEDSQHLDCDKLNGDQCSDCISHLTYCLARVAASPARQITFVGAENIPKSVWTKSGLDVCPYDVSSNANLERIVLEELREILVEEESSEQAVKEHASKVSFISMEEYLDKFWDENEIPADEAAGWL